MTATTANRGYPYPQGSDFLGDTAAHIQALAEALDTDAVAAADSIFLQSGANQSVPHSMWTTVTPLTVISSSGISWSAGAATVSRAGLYVITGYLSWTAASGTRYGRFTKNGTPVPGRVAAESGGGGPEQSLTRHIRLTAGDAIQWEAFQNSGATLNLNHGTENRFGFEMVRVSA